MGKHGLCKEVKWMRDPDSHLLWKLPSFLSPPNPVPFTFFFFPSVPIKLSSPLSVSHTLDISGRQVNSLAYKETLLQFTKKWFQVLWLNELKILSGFLFAWFCFVLFVVFVHKKIQKKFLCYVRKIYILWGISCSGACTTELQAQGQFKKSLIFWRKIWFNSGIFPFLFWISVEF